MVKFFFYTFSLFFLIGQSTLSAQQVPLTFRVDMQHETVSPKGVHVAGNFQQAAGYADNWNPGITPLSDNDGDGIYSLTVMVPPGNYLYKFINGNSWQDKPELPPADCAQNDGGGNYNRQLSVGPQGVTLPAIPFDSCFATLRLAINMSGESVSPNGVHVMGDFQAAAGYPDDWDIQATPMTDANADGTFEITLQVPAGTYQYAFINGIAAADVENPPVECSVPGNDGMRYREITVDFDAGTSEVYCFNSCTLCDPSVYSTYETYWWNDAVFYEIFVRSFYDSDGDGIGDFRGIIEKLDYLNDGDPETNKDLGITGIWLMPMLESPTYHGYDVTDYYQTEPDYGTMEDFEALLDACHERGIRVIIDFVMNHTSVQHPWFIQSANNQGEYRDWYVWSDEDPGGTGPWGQQLWHEKNGDYYYGIFWSGMPDLNYSHPPVKEEIFNAAAFWLEKGVDGFRLDAIKYLDEDGTVLENTPETFVILEDFHSLYKGLNAESMTVGEVWSNTASILPYVNDSRIDFCFEFDLAYSILGAINENSPTYIREQVRVIRDGYRQLQYAPFLTNHDIDRVYSTLGRIPDKMKQAATIYLTLPGVPFIYYGEEIGMTGTGIHENIRRPMQWDGSTHAGFSAASPWYGLGDNYQTNNVAAMEGDPESILERYRDLVQLRNRFAPLTKGYLLDLQTDQPEFLAYARIHEDEAAIVISHFGGVPTAPEISMPVSSMPQGTYRVYEEMSKQELGTIELDESGGFTDWSPETGSLVPRESIVLTLKPGSAVSTKRQTPGDIEVAVFPNPASEYVDIRTNYAPGNQITIQLLDVTGKVLLEDRAIDSVHRLDTGDLPSGLYFIRLRKGSGGKTVPFSIQRK